LLTKLRMKCSSCNHWNRVPVNKLLIDQPSPESKVEVMIPMYEPLETSKCKKCGKIIAEPKEIYLNPFCNHPESSQVAR